MLSDEAVFMVYLQLREFRLPACGCSWKTVSKTFRIPQPLVISWSSDIPAQCNQPQVCLSLFILTEWEQSIEGELLIVWDHWLFFQVCSTSQAVGDITHHRPSFSSSLAAIRMKCPLKSTKALKWAIWKAYLSHDPFFFCKWIDTRHLSFSIVEQFVSVYRSLDMSQWAYEHFMVHFFLLIIACFS